MLFLLAENSPPPSTPQEFEFRERLEATRKADVALVVRGEQQTAAIRALLLSVNRAGG